MYAPEYFYVAHFDLLPLRHQTINSGSVAFILCWSDSVSLITIPLIGRRRSELACSLRSIAI